MPALRDPSTMAAVALALNLVFGALAMGWCSWVQRRRTGSSGFHGIGGQPGSLEWLAGVGFVAALAVGLIAIGLQSSGVVSPLSLLDHAWINTVGLVIALAGILATLYAQHEMGESWRIGVDGTETTTLVTIGAFGLVRNPIFTAMLAFAFGATLLIPNIIAIVGFALLLTAIELQVRVVEEPYLLRVRGDSYRQYAQRVGRFVPGLGLMR